MNKNILMLTLATSFLTAFSSIAQTPTSSTTPSGLSGAVNSAPAKINLKFLEDALRHILNSVHSLSIDERIQAMDPNTSTINRVAGFNIEGAILHDYDELNTWGVLNKKDILTTGRNIGFQWIPYSITLLQDGSHLIKVSLIGLKNMIAFNNYRDWNPAYKYLDRLDFLTIKLDKNSSFKDLETLSLDFVDANAKFGIAGTKSTYLALTAGANAGLTLSNRSLPNLDQTTYESGANKNFPQRQMSDGTMYGAYENTGTGFSTSGNIGLELNIEKKRTRVNLKGSYSAGLNNYTVSDNKIHENNVILRQSHLTDDIFKVDGYKDANMKVTRENQYIHYSLDASRMISRTGKTPVRMGLIVKANVILNDKLTYPNQTATDLKDYQKEKVSGGLYINF